LFFLQTKTPRNLSDFASVTVKEQLGNARGMPPFFGSDRLQCLCIQPSHRGDKI
jgi:hypothetical protein